MSSGMEHSSELTVRFNNTCPICAREVAHYARAAENADAPVTFEGLGTADLAAHGLDATTAAKRFHVAKGGELLSGVPAFVALWETLPRWRWLARLISLPGICQIATFAYDHLAAPALFALHRRRMSRQ